MNTMTCAEVQEQLDLLAADECDPPSRLALESHMQNCPTCAANYEESRRLLSLLDLHMNEQGIERLRQRIVQQARPPRRMVLPVVRRAVAVAALLLIAVGLAWWLPNRRDEPGPSFALLATPRNPAPDKIPALPIERVAEAKAVLVRGVQSGKEFRDDLVKAQQKGKLPLPPAIALDLALVNTSEREVEVRLGDIVPTLELDLPGDGVIRIAAPDASTPDFLRPQSLHLGPGQQHIIHIDRLIAGSHKKLEYIYVTEPGDYTLTARLRFTVAGKTMTVSGPAVSIKTDNAVAPKE
jgi:Putative zinc-finger